MRRSLFSIALTLLFSGPALAFDGALLKLSSTQAVHDGTFPPAPYPWLSLQWTLPSPSTEYYDTKGFFNPLEPTRITIPAGVTMVRLRASTVFSGKVSNGQFVDEESLRELIVHKNGNNWFAGGFVCNQRAVWATTTDIGCSTAVIKVTAGDYFEARYRQLSGDPLNMVQSPGTWFSIEVVQ